MNERARSLTDPKLPSKNDLAEGPVSTDPVVHLCRAKARFRIRKSYSRSEVISRFGST